MEFEKGMVGIKCSELEIVHQIHGIILREHPHQWLN
jgi:hypothetical protein